ncbi:hypothetical protein ATANTOWER_007730 [Ataeniobius toweri]|uniref:Uncharacterized protein n=1 Tax=Ataeniobius toweri TaxID=208326 RepID=A0ABU7CFS9_9TELE|nr:hypothetical protein [Ataeniobius toweri]
MPESASPFMTSLLCPDPQFKPLPGILSPDSVLPALTLFLSPDHHLLLSHWVCKPDSQCDVALLPPDDHTEEPKFCFLILSWILESFKRRPKRVLEEPVQLSGGETRGPMSPPRLTGALRSFSNVSKKEDPTEQLYDLKVSFIKVQ